jgi:hypothetical protein
MNIDHPQSRVVACARQIMDVPEENEIACDHGVTSLIWFALGHAAILLYLALHLLTRLG